MRMIAGTGKAKAGEPSLAKCVISPSMMGKFQRRFAQSFHRGIVKPFTSRWQQRGRFVRKQKNNSKEAPEMVQVRDDENLN